VTGVQTCALPISPISFFGFKAVSDRRKLTPTAIRVAIKTPRIGVNPTSMRTTMAISEVKWNQYLAVSALRPRDSSITTCLAPNFLASNSTIRNMER